jgi:hypothetical protein
MNAWHALLFTACLSGCTRSSLAARTNGGPPSAADRGGHAGAPQLNDAGSTTRQPDAMAPDAVTPDAVTPDDDAATLAPSEPAVCPRMPDDIAVWVGDPAGYPSYALAGCQLLYVAADGGLHLRDLRQTVDTLIASPNDMPLRPSFAGSAADPTRVLVWESGVQRAVQLRVAGERHSLRGDYEHTTQPRATSGAVVFSGFRAAASTSDSDIVLYTIETASFSVVGGGPGQQLFADVSATQVAYSDFSEDPDGRFDDNGNDLADVVIVERASLAARHLTAAGKQAFPLLTEDGGLVYLDWALSHPEPKLSAYQIVAWDAQSQSAHMLADVATQPPFIRPSTFGNTVEWLERPYNSAARLLRVQRTGTASAALAWSMPNADPLAHISTPTSTLMAVRGLDAAGPRLLNVPR